MSRQAEREIVDDSAGIVLRQVVVGALDTNCWILTGTQDRTAMVVDPGDDPERILDACSDLHVTAVVLTHCHWDHVLGAPEVADALGVSVLAHPAEEPVWEHEQRHLCDHGYFDAGTATNALVASGGAPRPRAGQKLWNGTAKNIEHRTVLRAGGHRVMALHTPGHTPGGLSLQVGSHVLTGDTLFPGGPGLTGWPFSDFPTIIDSIESVLFRLPDDTQVHPGHGPSTTVAAERPALRQWVERGW